MQITNVADAKEKNKLAEAKRKEEKMDRENDLLKRAGNVHIDTCLKSKCEEITEEYMGGGAAMFGCRSHGWRAKVITVIKKKNIKTAPYVEIFVEKDEL